MSLRRKTAWHESCVLAPGDEFLMRGYCEKVPMQASRWWFNPPRRSGVAHVLGCRRSSYSLCDTEEGQYARQIIPVESGTVKTKLFLAMVAVLLFISPVSAAVVYKIDTSFAGTAPEGTTPWLVASFNQYRANEVDVTLTTTGLVGSEFVSAWYFNYSGTSPITVSQNGGSSPATVGVGSNAYQAVLGGKSDGNFDVLVQFPTSGPNLFTNGLTDSFAIQGTGVKESMFSALSEGGTYPDGFTAACVQAIGTEGATGLVTDVQPVPDPLPLWLLVPGLSGLVAVRRRLRKVVL